MTLEEKKNRILARGEQSDHAHVVVGDATVERNEDGEIIISVGNSEAILKHIKESAWLEQDAHVWTKEHGDIPLTPGETYRYVPQKEKNPYDDIIRFVSD